MTPIQAQHGTQFAHFAGLALPRTRLMQPATMICANLRADGASCGETALVHVVHYVYRPAEVSEGFAANHKLTESHYEIVCPRCGRRTQIEKH
jgi:hypothetical protein